MDNGLIPIVCGCLSSVCLYFWIVSLMLGWWDVWMVGCSEYYPFLCLFVLAFFRASASTCSGYPPSQSWLHKSNEIFFIVFRVGRNQF